MYAMALSSFIYLNSFEKVESYRDGLWECPRIPHKPESSQKLGGGKRQDKAFAQIIPKPKPKKTGKGALGFMQLGEIEESDSGL